MFIIPTMLHLILLSHSLLESIICSGIYNTEVQDIEFGTLRSVQDFTPRIKTYHQSLRHVIPDGYVNGNYVLVLGHAIYTTADLKDLQDIAGSFQYPNYNEGKGGNARLGAVSGIVTSPVDAEQLLFADHSNNCIRGVDRTTNTTYHLIGKCYVRGNVDGDRLDAKIGFPLDLVKSPSNKNQIFFYDNDFKSLRALIYGSSTWRVETVMYWQKKIDALSFDISGEFMYLAYETGIWRVRTDDWKTSNYVIDRHDTGYQDGPLTVAKIGKPLRLLFLDDDLFIFADDTNRNLRVVDLKSYLVSSICLPHRTNKLVAGTIDQCKVPLVRYLIKYEESSNFTIHIITHYMVATLSHKRKVINTVAPEVSTSVDQGGVSSKTSPAGPDGTKETIPFRSTELLPTSTQPSLGLAEEFGSWRVKNQSTLMYIGGGVLALGLMAAIILVHRKIEMGDSEEAPHRVSSAHSRVTTGSALTRYDLKSIQRSMGGHSARSSSVRSGSSSKSKRSVGKKRGKFPKRKQSRSKTLPVYDSSITRFPSH